MVDSRAISIVNCQRETFKAPCPFQCKGIPTTATKYAASILLGAIRMLLNISAPMPPMSWTEVYGGDIWYCCGAEPRCQGGDRPSQRFHNNSNNSMELKQISRYNFRPHIKDSRIFCGLDYTQTERDREKRFVELTHKPFLGA